MRFHPLVNPELDHLIEGLLEDRLSSEETQRLNLLLRSDPQAMDRYLMYIELHGALLYDQVVAGSPETAPDPPGADYRHARISAAPQSPAPMAISGYGRPIHRESARRVMTRFWAAAAALAIVVVTIAIIADSLQRTPQSSSAPIVATLSESAGAQWRDAGSAPVSGEGLAVGRRLELAGGCAQITLASGGTVIVEGPASVNMNSATEVSLAEGKLAATVPGGGFVVRTPTAVVTDLGTEFGLNALADGTTHVEVFRGRVQADLRTVPPSANGSTSQILGEGQAAVVTSTSVALNPWGAIPQHYVRSLATAAGPLDVVDLTCGGDGTTHRRGRGINVATGEAGALPQVFYVEGDGKYHAVPSLPVVDGCFVPNGHTQVDSVGHGFDFPLTADKSCYLLWGGGPFPIWNNGPVPDFPQSTVDAMSSVLGGVDYSQNGHGALAMHSSKGVTFDLKAIRALHPGRPMTKFHCIAGNTWTKGPSLVDLFVLVDGVAVFQKKQFTGADGAFPIDVPLHDQDRFLTLTTTDGGDFIAHDWVIIGDPVL